jgi:hypothetical protein
LQVSQNRSEIKKSGALTTWLDLHDNSIVLIPPTPLNRLDLILNRLDLISNRLDLIPNRLDLFANRLDLILISYISSPSATSHPPSARSRPHGGVIWRFVLDLVPNFHPTPTIHSLFCCNSLTLKSEYYSIHIGLSLNNQITVHT